VEGFVVIQVSNNIQTRALVRLDLVDHHPAGFAGAYYDDAL
jgi:hypothetical protein